MCATSTVNVHHYSWTTYKLKFIHSFILIVYNLFPTALCTAPYCICAYYVRIKTDGDCQISLKWWCSQQGTSNVVYLSLPTSLQGGVEWPHLPCKAQCSLSLPTSLLGGVEWPHLLCRAQCSLSGWAVGRRSWVDTCGSWWGGQWSWEGCRSLLGRGQGHLSGQPMCRKDSRSQPGTPHTECSLEYFRLEIFGSG